MCVVCECERVSVLCECVRFVVCGKRQSWMCAPCPCFVLAPAPDPLQGFTHGHGRVDLTPKVGTQQTQQEPESACVRV